MLKYHQDTEYLLRRSGISIPEKLRGKKRVIHTIQKYEDSDLKLEDEVFIKELNESLVKLGINLQESANNGIEMDFKKLALFKTTHVWRKRTFDNCYIFEHLTLTEFL